MFNVGDRVVVPKATNSVWCGVGVVDKMWDDDAVSLVMETGRCAGRQGTFRISEGVYLKPEDTKKYFWTDEAECGWDIVDSLDDVPDFAAKVFELGDELVKKVTWEKKDV